MKKIILICLIITTASIYYFIKITSVDYIKIDNMALEALKDDEKQKDFLCFLNKEIKKHPSDPRLLRYRLDLLINLSLLQSAKRDVAKLILLTDSVNYRYFFCLLEESIGEGTHDENVECYRKVSEIQKKLGGEVDAFHALMAELPEAKDILQTYLDTLGSVSK